MDQVAANRVVEVDIIPEIAAAVEAYRRSLHAGSGMRVMVDVGATEDQMNCYRHELLSIIRGNRV
jgi:hypothetical protein